MFYFVEKAKNAFCFAPFVELKTIKNTDNKIGICALKIQPDISKI